MKKYISLLSGLLVLFVSLTALAEQKRYNIEVVIFEDNSKRYINSEQWPVIHHGEEESTVTSADLKRNDTSFKHNSSNSLAPHVAKLESSTRYNVLLHQSWQQAGLSNLDAISIPVNTDLQKNIESFDLTHRSKLEGTLKLVLGRYLHIHADLLYKRVNNEPDSTDLNKETYSEYKINFQRRMRSKELHYVDHPLVGMLVIVVPVESEKKESAE